MFWQLLEEHQLCFISGCLVCELMSICLVMNRTSQRRYWLKKSSWIPAFVLDAQPLTFTSATASNGTAHTGTLGTEFAKTRTCVYTCLISICEHESSVWTVVFLLISAKVWAAIIARCHLGLCTSRAEAVSEQRANSKDKEKRHAGIYSVPHILIVAAVIDPTVIWPRVLLSILPSASTSVLSFRRWFWSFQAQADAGFWSGVRLADCLKYSEVKLAPNIFICVSAERRGVSRDKRRSQGPCHLRLRANSCVFRSFKSSRCWLNFHCICLVLAKNTSLTRLGSLNRKEWVPQQHFTFPWQSASNFALDLLSAWYFSSARTENSQQNEAYLDTHATE